MLGECDPPPCARSAAWFRSLLARIGANLVCWAPSGAAAWAAACHTPERLKLRCPLPGSLLFADERTRPLGGVCASEGGVAVAARLLRLLLQACPVGTAAVLPAPYSYLAASFASSRRSSRSSLAPVVPPELPRRPPLARRPLTRRSVSANARGTAVLFMTVSSSVVCHVPIAAAASTRPRCLALFRPTAVKCCGGVESTSRDSSWVRHANLCNSSPSPRSGKAKPVASRFASFVPRAIRALPIVASSSVIQMIALADLDEFCPRASIGC